MRFTTIKTIFVSLILLILTFDIQAQTKNPILPGFYPDPSICRVGDDYYIVNSSFSFFPGIPIFHSKDLSNWKQIGHVLDRPSQLNLTDEWMSAGLYAPSLRYHEGTFYLINTLMGAKEGKQGGNFYVTAKNAAGPWSDPIWLDEIDGIDPSFFFDNDGKAYIVNNGPVADGKPRYSGHRSVWLQEFNLKTQKPIGKRVELLNGGIDPSTNPIWIEGPHLFNKDGFYYLLCAEGGTGIEHREVILRSKNIWGPYEVGKDNPILTQFGLPENRKNPVTCTGHADFVDTPDGDWVSVFLGCQPYEGEHFNTGRQTFILPVEWKKGKWPMILEKGKSVPFDVSLPLKPAEGKVSFQDYSSDWKDDFDSLKLNFEWNFIRTPKEKWYNIDNGKLTIDARPISIDEVGNPSFIGRRLQHKKAEFITNVTLIQSQGKYEGRPMEAGIVAYQNEEFYYKLVLERKENGYYLILSSATQEFDKIQLNDYKPGQSIFLKMQIIEKDFQTYYSLDETNWKPLGSKLDARHLSTKSAGGYIGAYFGLYAHAKSSQKAVFNWAKYKELK
ncbi:glycoside hydrolase family 43 protein [Arenibacter echinorum]|uniref:Alpha-N-arabinofuranosidase n=1 Tax=Arenibacter echinorum TaxID=440515 RepID=A0A327R068_9FLAO|nr:glycoside hydrolase family 43 protein [Arenibacter echinorum]RAJ10259.1 alpha-N-arabinofuranosidase [Arenibacter echinorum]